MRRTTLAAALAALLAVPAAARAGATITIVNLNAPGVGFNDPTPAAPVGGNPGTTVGEQRLIAFQHAADLWGATLDSSVEIRIQASFEPLSCSPTAGVLGSAGAIQIFRDFPGAAWPETWYHVALANKRSGEDLAPGAPGTNADDLRARFNSVLGSPTADTDGTSTPPGCLVGGGWYYGLDTNQPSNLTNLVTVLLHEFAHGLGFQSFVSLTTGALPLGLPDVYSRFYLDQGTGKARLDMTDAERVASAINTRRVVWTGERVTAAVPAVLAPGTPLLRVTTPTPIAGVYPVGTASWGAPLAAGPFTGVVVVGRDAAIPGSSPTTTDGCSPLENDVAGKLVLVDRGTCAFTVKARNAQDAGALGVLVANNAPGSPPPGLGGADPTVTIPAVMVTQALGATLKAEEANNVLATLTVDPTVLQGASPDGLALLNAPNPVQTGSSISHWDPVTFPSQLMEPAINQDLTHGVAPPADLTLALFRDIGWYLDRDLDRVDDERPDECPASDVRATVFVGAEDTGVENTVLSNGCTIADLLDACGSAAASHGDYVSCAAAVTNALKDGGFISGQQKGRLQRAVAHDH